MTGFCFDPQVSLLAFRFQAVVNGIFNQWLESQLHNAAVEDLSRNPGKDDIVPPEKSAFGESEGNRDCRVGL